MQILFSADAVTFSTRTPANMLPEGSFRDSKPPLLRTMDDRPQPCLGAPTLQRHFECLDCQVPVVHRADRPADDEARVEVKDRGQIELAALADHELGGVAHPPLIRRLCCELSIEQIVGDRQVVVAHGRAFEALALPRLQLLFLHQTDHPLAADPLLLLEQVLVDARTAVAALARGKRRLHEDLQLPIPFRVGRFGPVLPAIESTAGDPHAAT